MRTKVANFLRLHVGRTSFRERSAVRFIPSGVASKAQEMNTTTAKPTSSNTTKVSIVQLGASNAGMNAT